MSLEENKAIVRRFIMEVLAKGDVALVDQLLAPNYVNRSMPGQGVDNFKQFLGNMKKTIPDLEMSIEDLVAEGDKVVARYTMKGTNAGSGMGSAPAGKRFTLRGLTFFRLANGKIVEDDPITNQDMQ